MHNPRLESVAAEAEGDAEALVADLTSPIRLRRRGAKSALGWMAEEDTATASPSPRSFDTYDEAVVAATEWDVAAEVAMTQDMLEVLKHLGLEKYSAMLARMGIATLLDVGKRTPEAMIEKGGLKPRECQALLSELLGGCGVQVLHSEAAASRSAWGRSDRPMWVTPPRVEEPAAPAGTSSPSGARAASAKASARATERAVQERENELTKKWLGERVQLKHQIVELEQQNECYVQDQLRTKILREEIAVLEADADKWEKTARVWKDECRQLRRAARSTGTGQEVEPSKRPASVERTRSEAADSDAAVWKERTEEKWRRKEEQMRKTIESWRHQDVKLRQEQATMVKTIKSLKNALTEHASQRPVAALQFKHTTELELSSSPPQSVDEDSPSSALDQSSHIEQGLEDLRAAQASLLNDHTSALETMRADRGSSEARLRAEVEELRSACSTARADLEASKSRTPAALESAAAETIVTDSEAVKTLEATLAEKTARVASLEAAVASLKAGHEKVLGSLESSQQERLDALAASQATAVSDHAAAVETQASKLQAAEKEASVAIARAAELAQSLNEAKAQHAKETTASKSRQAALEAELDELRAAHAAELKSVQSNLSRVTTELEASRNQEELEKLRTAHASLLSEHASLVETHATAVSDHAAAVETQASKLQAAEKEASVAIARAAELAQSLNEAKAQHAKETTASKSRQAALEAELDELRAAHASLLADHAAMAEAHVLAQESEAAGWSSILMTVPFLQNLSVSELAEVTATMVSKQYDPEATIIAEGEPGEEMYVLVAGESRASIQGNLVHAFHRGDYFGETALLMNQPRSATVCAGPEGARCLVLGKEPFDRVCANHPDVFEGRQQLYDTTRHEAEELSAFLEREL